MDLNSVQLGCTLSQLDKVSEMFHHLKLLSHQILAEWLSASKNALFKQSLNAPRNISSDLFLLLKGATNIQHDNDDRIESR